MSTILQLGWGNFLLRYITETLKEILPRRFKRMFYVGSALGLFLNNPEPDHDLLRSMNKALRLAHAAEGIGLSVKVYALIWRNFENEIIYLSRFGSVRVDQLKELELDPVSRREVGFWFARQAPSWLRYGPVDMMASDVETMIAVEKVA